jgi:putative colanic acid biosynthesis UDP-glucose lipid carrier transferase
MSDFQATKSTSFHSVALNIIYVLILIVCHFVFPYIHELVFSFFNGLFLILSMTLFFYLNAVLRTSSISRLSYFSIFFRLILVITFFSFGMIFIAFMTNTIEILKREEFLIFLFNVWLFCLLAMILAKYFYTLIKPTEKPNIVLLTDLGLDVDQKEIGFLSSNKNFKKQFQLSEIDALIDYAVDNGVEGVYISLNSANLNLIEGLIEELSKYAFDLFWVLPESFFADSAYSKILKPVLLNGSPVSLDSNQYLLKRSLDVVGSIALLIVVSPLFIFVSFLIKISDRGPIFYHQLRHGQFGKEFYMVKFRSMVVGSDYSDQQVTPDDKRVTMIGKIIRKTSFDEIPQLLNVLKGEMSLVGPRPHIISETNLYSKKLIRFLSRHQVKPGLTGLAQIRTRGKTNSLELMQTKLESDLEYINEWTFYKDIKILLSTPISLWKNRDSNV